MKKIIEGFIMNNYDGVSEKTEDHLNELIEKLTSHAEFKSELVNKNERIKKKDFIKNEILSLDDLLKNTTLFRDLQVLNELKQMFLSWSCSKS